MGSSNRQSDGGPIKVCVFTAARSEYGLMRWVMQEIADDPRFQLSVIVAGSHLDERFGKTVSEVEADGFSVDAMISSDLPDGSREQLPKIMGQLIEGIGATLTSLQPDIVMVMGDRFELLPLMSVAVVLNIPIAHVSGGEITEGAIDDVIRHAMTKASHLHFVANREYRDRVIQMGEEPWRVCISGEPGLENILRLPRMSRDDLSANLGLDLSQPTALVTLHPETLSDTPVEDQVRVMCEAMEESGLNFLITYPNADPGFDVILRFWTAFCEKRSNAVLVKNLGQKRYLSSLASCAMMIGNSSSGIVEAPSFNLPVVNIGRRQAGRMRAANVIDVNWTKDDIGAGIAAAARYDRSATIENPYGDGRSAKTICDFMFNAFSRHGKRRIAMKKFNDLHP
jgi:GDP/UDP-N,N'-diacetylbacillosamine 2-epimerase (hydrolysing)